MGKRIVRFEVEATLPDTDASEAEILAWLEENLGVFQSMGSYNTLLQYGIEAESVTIDKIYEK